MPSTLSDCLLAGMKRIAAAIDLLLPRTCIVCGTRLLSSERHICLLCAGEMPLTRFWKQSHNLMSDRFNDIIQKNLINGKSATPTSCHEMPEAADACPGYCREPYAYAAALFTYHAEAQFRFIPYNIKYKGDIRAGEYFGRMLGARLIPEEHWKDADIIIPVPLHWTRRFRRGYNQAEAIASGLASAMGIPVRNDILFRRKRTRTQTKLSMKERYSMSPEHSRQENAIPENTGISSSWMMYLLRAILYSPSLLRCERFFRHRSASA
jgi:predicted amidophosphoribosyltransferase